MAAVFCNDYMASLRMGDCPYVCAVAWETGDCGKPLVDETTSDAGSSVLHSRTYQPLRCKRAILLRKALYLGILSWLPRRR